MKKIAVSVHRLKVFKEGTKRVAYTVRFIVFDPKKYFVSTPDAKDLCRKQMHCSKKKMNDEYDSIYGVWMKIGHGKNTHVEFNNTTKAAANVIFIIPKKYRRHAYEVINGTELPWSDKDVKDVFK